MSNAKHSPDLLFEVSWEVCNKVGGIHTVISTKAQTVTRKFADRYVLLGPDLSHEGVNPEFEEDPNLLKAWRQSLYNEGIRVRVVHLVRFRVPYDEGKHAAQLGGQCRAVLLIAVDDDLGVAVGLEDVPLGLQLGAQVHEVVNFTVEHADDGAILIVHGLLACGQVDDAQTAEAQRNGRARVVAADMVAFHIGAAVYNAVRHSVQDGLALFTQTGKANKTTHGTFPFSL